MGYCSLSVVVLVFKCLSDDTFTCLLDDTSMSTKHSTDTREAALLSDEIRLSLTRWDLYHLIINLQLGIFGLFQ